MNDIEKRFGLINRLGTKEEIEDISMLLALGCYKDAVSFSINSKLSDNVHELGMNKYLEFNKNYFKKEMNGSLFVVEYEKYNIKLYTCFIQSIDKINKNECFVSNLYFFKSKIEFIQVDSFGGFYINFENEEKLLKTLKLGKISKPTDSSLIKTLEIQMAWDRNRDINITFEDICKKYDLAKSTYYRVNKWLVTNPLIKLTS